MVLALLQIVFSLVSPSVTIFVMNDDFLLLKLDFL